MKDEFIIDSSVTFFFFFCYVISHYGPFFFNIRISLSFELNIPHVPLEESPVHSCFSFLLSLYIHDYTRGFV